jgi:hypothetical protein
MRRVSTSSDFCDRLEILLSSCRVYWRAKGKAKVDIFDLARAISERHQSSIVIAIIRAGICVPGTALAHLQALLSACVKWTFSFMIA